MPQPLLEMRINLRAIVDNYKKIQNLTKTRVSSVVKADSYGLEQTQYLRRSTNLVVKDFMWPR
ncbi:MAG: hypothetical protein H6925_05690 [Holosporaceae bacterium]|nr:MAG: hypothetical protein H6925_05690 [Holosporaceae bacterium]